ncbi:MAG: hypothetical protein NTU98_03485 [Bacteroidetes bacterium]|nr:hypothetical protein [Bacteroidota bacterium]
MTTNESLESLLLVENSRRNTDLVADLILQKPELFDELVRIFLRNEEPVSRRAAWVTDTISEQKPELILNYLNEIVTSLPRFTHDGMKRESLRILSRSPLPDQQLGLLIKHCFDWLTSAGESVAVKMYSMEILYRISQQEPDLKKELADSIEWRMQEETPGFKAHGKKLLAKLSRELSGR